MALASMTKTIYSKRHKDIVKKLRRARIEAGLKQTDVAKKLRKQQSYVSRCESGDHRLDVIELHDFAQLYGKPLDFFTK